MWLLFFLYTNRKEKVTLKEAPTSKLLLSNSRRDLHKTSNNGITSQSLLGINLILENTLLLLQFLPLGVATINHLNYSMFQ